MTTTRSLVSKTITVKDVAYPAQEVSIPYYTANFHIEDYDVYYGDGTITSAVAKAGSVIYFENGDLKDIFFKNKTAGDTATVQIVATVPSEYIKQVLKL